MRVVLVDGVGNAVIHECVESAASMIHIGEHLFVRSTEEPLGELPVYRLFVSSDFDNPEIRHVNLRLEVL